MSRHLKLRRALAVPAAVALALGGVVLAAAPASAAEAGLTVTAPVDNSTVDSRTVEVSGSVYGGSTVIVYAEDDSVLARTNVGGEFGEPTDYSVTVEYSDEAAVDQSIEVGGLYGGSGIPRVAVNFTLPEVAPEFNFSVTSPTEGETVDSRTVTFTGTGTDGSTVNVLTPEGNRVPGTSAAVVSNGTWSTTGTYTDDADINQTVNVNQVTGGAGRGNATVNFTLPEVAPEFNFSVTSPTEGETVDSRTVTFTGTGTDGSTVNVLTPEGNRVPGTSAAVVSNGTWSTTGTYTDDADINQTVNVNQVTGGAGRGNATVNFTLPEVAPEFNFSVTSPTEGETVDSRTVTFTGTGTDGSTVNVLTPEGNRVPGTSAAVVSNGTWSTTGTYTDDADINQTVNVNQVTGGAGRGNATVNFTLPAVPVVPVLDAPVITSPTEGEKVVGDQVTFEGTGQPGAYVGVTVVPTELIEDAEPTQRVTAAAAAAAPADPADPIIVAEDGTWNVTLALDPADYTVVAIQSEVENPTDPSDISAPSEPVSFTLAAASVTPIPAPDASGSGDSLAVTGAEASGFVGLSALLLVVGAALMIVRKYRAQIG